MKHFTQKLFFLSSSIVLMFSMLFSFQIQTLAAEDEITLEVTAGSDITTALQKAIKAGYKTINIPSGTYVCGRINLNAGNEYTINATNATFQAPTGHASAMLATADNSSAHDIIVNGGTWINTSNNTTIQIYGTPSNISLQNMTISNSGKDSIRVQNGTNVEIKNCVIKNPTNYGIVLISSKNCILNDCKITNAKNTAIRLEGSTGISLSKTSAHSIGAYGFYTDASTATLTDCICSENYWSGAAITKKSNITVIGGKFCSNGKRPDKKKNDDSQAAGIGIYSASTLTITNADCSKNHACGIAANGSKGQICTAKVYGCSLNSNEDHGFGGRPYCKLIITKSPDGKRSTVIGNTHNGLLVCDNSIAEKITDCDISGNGQYGISISDSASANLISNSNVSSNKKAGIHLTDKCSVKKIEKCTVNKNKDNGISLYKNSKANLIQSCTCASNTLSGLYLAESSNATAKGCTFNNNKKDGATAVNAGTKLSLKSCTSKKNKKNGYRIAGGARLSSMQKCTATSNSIAGLELSAGATLGTYKSNKYSKNKKYAIIVSASNVKIKTQKK